MYDFIILFSPHISVWSSEEEESETDSSEEGVGGLERKCIM